MQRFRPSLSTHSSAIMLVAIPIDWAKPLTQSPLWFLIMLPPPTLLRLTSVEPLVFCLKIETVGARLDLTGPNVSPPYY